MWVQFSFPFLFRYTLQSEPIDNHYHSSPFDFLSFNRFTCTKCLMEQEKHSNISTHTHPHTHHYITFAMCERVQIERMNCLRKIDNRNIYSITVATVVADIVIIVVVVFTTVIVLLSYISHISTSTSIVWHCMKWHGRTLVCQYAHAHIRTRSPHGIARWDNRTWFDYMY